MSEGWKTRALGSARRFLLGRGRRDREIARTVRAFSELELHHDVPRPRNVPHGAWVSYLSEKFNKPGFKVLEIGSRTVISNLRGAFSNATYIGFDICPGENVDVSGDAHKLSSYFEPETQFDFVFSTAVFEHFHMPWVVAEEIHRVLKVGGYVFVETHFSYAAHERPWNFFQFSDLGLRALFNKGLGFELIDLGMSNPINGVFSANADEYLRGRAIPDLYCHSEILCRKVRDVSGFSWRDATMDDIVDGSRYPAQRVQTQY